jgi:hypothetical protein
MIKNKRAEPIEAASIFMKVAKDAEAALKK